jgi:hypothetical protein
MARERIPPSCSPEPKRDQLTHAQPWFETLSEHCRHNLKESSNLQESSRVASLLSSATSLSVRFNANLREQLPRLGQQRARLTSARKRLAAPHHVEHSLGEFSP